jgi:hypothetical protein
MPKAKARKHRKAANNSTAKALQADQPGTATPAARIKSQAQRRSISSATQGLVMSGMVALGCWGMAVSFIFFTTDPNRYLYGGMAALMALMWSSMFGMRFRKSMQQR